MADNVLRMSVRFCRIGRIYGPGMPPLVPGGPAEKPLERPVRQVGLVAVHCWNLGEPDGPYPIEPGTRCPGDPADWVPRAHEIVTSRIRPAMDAARKAGITVFHLAAGSYADRYASFAEIKDDPELRDPTPGAPPFERCLRPRTKEEQYLDLFGPDFPGAAWDTHPEEFDIARTVRPAEGEPVVTNGWQLNGLCRRMDIDTLFFCGFMANVCLINSSGAVREMADRFGYRCVVLRDCTTAYEYEDTHERMEMTRAAVRLIESGMGYSVSSGDFIGAALAAAGEKGEA